MLWTEMHCSGGVRREAEGLFAAAGSLPGRSGGWLPRGMHLVLKSDSESCEGAGGSEPAPREALGPGRQLWKHRVGLSALGWGSPD